MPNADHIFFIIKPTTIDKGVTMKQQRIIDSARKARPWLRDIIIPAVGAIAFVAMSENAYKRCRATMDHVRNRKPGQP